MAQKKLILVLTANEIYPKDAYHGGQGFSAPQKDLTDADIDNTNEDIIQEPSDMDVIAPLDSESLALNNKFFDSLTFSYLPILAMCDRLTSEGVPFKFAFVMPSVLCDLLSDKRLLDNYKKHLLNRIELGEREVIRAQSTDLYQNALMALEIYKRVVGWVEKINGSILSGFENYAKKGNIEIIATTATNIFLPLYSDIPSTLRAQIDAGVRSYRNYFKEMPNGFWLPHQAYISGIEGILREYNINYTILNEKSFLLSKNEPKRGIFYPATFNNSVACFSNDTNATDILFGKNGYCQDENYLDPAGDIGYLYDVNDLFPYIKSNDKRKPLGYKYYNKVKKSPQFLQKKENIYDIRKAINKCKMDAKDFITNQAARLNDAEALIGDTDFLSLVIPIDLNMMENTWREGTYFLEQCFREAAATTGEDAISFDFAKSVLENHYNLQIISPYGAADNKSGFGDTLVTDKNSYMLTYTRKAAKRMADMARRFPDQSGLRQRLLKVAATELLIAQDSSWAEMVNNEWFDSYAKRRFKQSINDFTQVFESLGSNEVSTLWLTNLEKEHDLFPFVNYKIWAK